MNEEEKLLLDIDRYLRNEMDAVGRVAFEARMNGDASLKNKVEEFRRLNTMLDSDVMAFKKRLVEVEKELTKENFFLDVARSKSRLPENTSGGAGASTSPQTEPGQVIKMKYVWAVAASLALLVGMFWFFNREPEYQQLAMNAAEETFERTRGVDDDLVELFNSGKYQEYIEKAEQVIADSNVATLQLKAGIVRSYILLRQPDQALSFLQSLPRDEMQNCEMQFLEALVWVEKHEQGKATQLLHLVQEKGCYPFNEKVKEILKKIE